jgi:membrane protease YdiL (CAAX protease family)
MKLGDPRPASTSRPAFMARMSQWAIVRIAIYAAMLIAVLVASTLITDPLIPAAPSPLRHTLLLARNIASPILLLTIYALAVRWMERRPAREVDPRAGSGLFALGLLLGLGLMATVYLCLYGLGRATFAPGDGAAGLAGGLAVAFAAAVLEELVLRAVLFRILEEASGTTIAVTVSAVVFGLLHAFNHGATPLSTVAIALEAGVLLAMAYALTHNLWLAIGIHMGWNFTEGALFGAAVSGGTQAHSVLRSTVTGPAWLSGGAFGPEASVVSIAVCLLAAGVMALMIIRRRGWRPLVFRPRLA